MNCDSQKEREFYFGVNNAAVLEDGVERDLMRMVLGNDLSDLDDEDICYVLGAYARYVAAGGKPFLDQTDRGDTK